VRRGDNDPTTMRLLLTGDIHIGRTSTRLPSGGDGSGARAVDAWERIVETAIAERCEMLLLSGDVADQENGFWEAVGPLERGIARLAEHDITTIAVSGNHDHGVLGRLAETLDRRRFALLGRGGTWERITIRDGTDRPILHLDGWSFPRERVGESPLDSYKFPRVGDAPILGMVHGDLDAPNSPYAPLRSDKLCALPPQGWLLGHIHKPSLTTRTPGQPWILYPGSPQALDPGESGVHGAWIVEIEQGRLGRPRMIPLSSVRYEPLSIDVSVVTDCDSLDAHLSRAIRTAADAFADEAGSPLKHLVLRIQLAGECRWPPMLARSIEGLRASESHDFGAFTCVIDRILDETTPYIDLPEAARSPSALGVVARLLLALEETSDTDAPGEHRDGATRREVDSLIEQTRRDLENLLANNRFAALAEESLGVEAVRERLRIQARRLLGALMAQSPLASPLASPLEIDDRAIGSESEA